MALSFLGHYRLLVPCWNYSIFIPFVRALLIALFSALPIDMRLKLSHNVLYTNTVVLNIKNKGKILFLSGRYP